LQKNKSDDEIKCSKQIDQEILKLKGYNSTYNFNVVLKLAKQVDSLFDLMTQKTKLHYRTLKDKNIKPSLTLGNCFHDLTLSIQKIQEYLMKAEYNVKNI
jgi:RNAse (barnase) inhibitor barstar